VNLALQHLSHDGGLLSWRFGGGDSGRSIGNTCTILRQLATKDDRKCADDVGSRCSQNAFQAGNDWLQSWANQQRGMDESSFRRFLFSGLPIDGPQFNPLRRS
jgi:hypothetical protein